jgi:hypothetical protein
MKLYAWQRRVNNSVLCNCLNVKCQFSFTKLSEYVFLNEHVYESSKIRQSCSCV